MKRNLILTFTTLLLLTAGTLKAGVNLTTFQIQGQYLWGFTNNILVQSGQNTTFTADFNFMRAGDLYNTVSVYLVYRETNGTVTTISEAKWKYNGDWLFGDPYTWSGTITGTLPAGKTTGTVSLYYQTFEAGYGTSPFSSMAQYGIHVNGGTTPVNPYPGSVIMNNWSALHEESHRLDYMSSNMFAELDFYIQGQAFRAYNYQATGTIPIHEFIGRYPGVNNTSALYGTSTSADPFWHYSRIAFYAFQTQIAGSVPVYCYTNAAGKNHFFSIQNETDPYWHKQYVAFYAYPIN